MSNISLISLKINNTPHEFHNPLTIFQACLSKHIFIPRFCYHVALKIAGNCRMCLVEEKSSLKPVASCAVSILSGQAIHTNTEIVKRAREGVLEYLLANHPLDCPICDQGGECDLQDQTMVFGADRGRFYEHKRTTPNKNLGFLIKTFLNRCIHCARCTRFLHDLAGTPDIQLLGRGLKTEISNYVGGFIKSEISGNVIDLCPVGALTSKPYAFRARPWELFSVYSFDILDGFGSSIQLDFRGLELLRILPKPNKFLNEEWISDKTRFCYDAFSVQRLSSPTKLQRGFYHSLSWLECLFFYKNFMFSLKSRGNLGASPSFGDFLDLETATTLISFFSNSGCRRVGQEFLTSDTFDFRASFSLNKLRELDTTSASLEGLVFFLFDINLRFESPLLNLKIRRIFSDFCNNIYLAGFLSNVNFEFEHMAHEQNQVSINVFLSQENRVAISSVLRRFAWSTQTSSSNFSNLTRLETGLINTSGPMSIVEFFFGQPEGLKFLWESFLIFHFYHHMEDEFLKELRSNLNIFLPTRFYFEKVASYINNSHNFFVTSYHFSYKLPNTKDDHKIIRALQDFVTPIKFGGPLDMGVYLQEKNNLPQEDAERWDPSSYYVEVPGAFFIYVPVQSRGSVFNNFFATSVITRLSSILSLCSRKLAVINDYIYTSLN